MRSVKIFIYMAVIFFFLCQGMEAFGKVYLDIDSPAFQKYPIAITDFQKFSSAQTKEDLPVWLSDTLAQHLNMTGFFNIINKKAFLQDQGRATSPGGKINFADWTVIGAEYLVKGVYNLTGKTLVIEYRLFDVVKGELLSEKKYSGRMDDRKEIIRKIAQEILLALTGDGSVFNTKIAFVLKKNQSSDIYSINFDGSELTQITNFATTTLSPRWSPDGQSIAFMSHRDGNPDLYVRRLKDYATSKISAFKGLNLPGAWSADGKKMLMTLSKDGNEEIYLKDIGGGSLRRLTHEFSIDVSPAWSPDGRKIAFVSNRSGTPQIYLMDHEGNGVKRLTYEGNYNTSPAWSPKGNRIVYEGRKDGRFQIFSIDEDGSHSIQLSPAEGQNESPSWSPDGRYLAFSQKIAGKSRICVMNANGSNVRVVYENVPGCISPSWSPRLK